MDNSLWIVAILVIFLCIRKKRRTAAAVWHIQNRRKKNKEILVMKELVKQFIGKECIIHTIDSRFNRITRSCVDTVAGYFNMLLIFRNLCASAFSAVTDLAHSASFLYKGFQGISPLSIRQGLCRIGTCRTSSLLVKV